MPHSSINRLIRNVSLRQLQIFEAVVRFGGVTKAAEALHLSQPTVSVQVKKLSTAIGHTLIDQHGRKIRLTPIGREVHEAALDVLNRLLELSDSASERDQELKGELRISVVTTAKYFIPQMISRFIQQHPLVTPHLTITNRANILDRLKSNEDDLFIMGQVPNNLDVRIHQFINNKLVIAAHPDHPLAQFRNIPMAQLEHERFLVREKGSGTRQILENMFAEQGIQIEPYMELSSSEAIKQCVMAKLGISLLSEHNMGLELENNRIALLKINGFPVVRSWYAVHNSNRKLPLISRTFLDEINAEGEPVLLTGSQTARKLKVIPINSSIK